MRPNVHNKTAGVDETAKLFKILQNIAVHVLFTVHYRKKIMVAKGLENIKLYSDNKKRTTEECPNYILKNAKKVILKILKSGFQQCMEGEFPDIQARFRSST